MNIKIYTPDGIFDKDTNFLPPVDSYIFLDGRSYKVIDLIYDLDSNIVRLYAISK